MSSPTTWKTDRARVAALTRDRQPDDPELIAARQSLKTKRLELAIREALDSPPAPTADQRQHLASLITGGGAK